VSAEKPPRGETSNRLGAVASCAIPQKDAGTNLREFVADEDRTIPWTASNASVQFAPDFAHCG
jgi:hypothetical protein